MTNENKKLENVFKFIKKVKLKVFLTSLVAGASLFTANYTEPVYADGDCTNAQQAGTRFIWTGPGSWKLWTTAQQELTSNIGARKLAFTYKKLDLQADNELARFVQTKVQGGSKLKGEEGEAFIESETGSSEDAVQGFNDIITEYSSQTEALLVGAQLVAKCHTPGKEVRLTRGINSESAIGAQRIKNQDFGEGPNSTNSATKSFRRDAQGYSSYDNFENF